MNIRCCVVNVSMIYQLKTNLNIQGESTFLLTDKHSTKTFSCEFLLLFPVTPFSIFIKINYIAVIQFNVSYIGGSMIK